MTEEHDRKSTEHKDFHRAVAGFFQAGPGDRAVEEERTTTDVTYARGWPELSASLMGAVFDDADAGKRACDELETDIFDGFVASFSRYAHVTVIWVIGPRECHENAAIWARVRAVLRHGAPYVPPDGEMGAVLGDHLDTDPKYAPLWGVPHDWLAYQYPTWFANRGDLEKMAAAEGMTLDEWAERWITPEELAVCCRRV